MLNYTLLGTLVALMTTLPLAWKWQLGIRRTAFVVVVLSLLSGLIIAFLGNMIGINAVLRPGLVWLLTLAAAFAILAYRFYRDPKRQVPDRDNVIVSPADGVVLYVHESRGGMLPVSTKHGHNYTLQELTRTPLQSEEAVVIGIGMSFLDVHVNRAPIAGRISRQRHFPGRFGSLRLPEMVFENERATTVIERKELQVAVVQIASRLVRQIVTFVCEGQEVALGQRIGVIRLGSQVDLVLPTGEDVTVTITPGERVVAGESVVAMLRRSNAGAAKRSGVLASGEEGAWLVKP
jgi:phosphatidylserine decarboxylase